MWGQLNSNILTLNGFDATLGTINDASSAAYVKTNGTGRLIQSVSSLPVLFPVGNSTYDPVTITNRTGTTDNFSVKVSNEVLSGGTTGSAISNVVGRTWTVNKTNSNVSPGCDLTFTWQPGDVSGLLADQKLFAWSGSAWVEQNAGNISRTATSITYTGYTGSLSNTLFMVGNPAPAITSFKPAAASPGATVTLTGTGFTNATAVSFGGVAATSFTVVNSTTITAVVAGGAAGSVSVTTPGGSASLAGFTMIAAPTITYFTPSKAYTGQTVTIIGTNFSTTSSVSFGGTSAFSFVVVSPTQITAVVGTGSSGTVSVSAGGVATKTGFIFGTPFTSIDVLAGWNQSNTSTKPYPYAASYIRAAVVSSASQNYSGLVTQNDVKNIWKNSNTSASLDVSTAPYLTYSVTTPHSGEI